MVVKFDRLLSEALNIGGPVPDEDIFGEEEELAIHGVVHLRKSAEPYDWPKIRDDILTIIRDVMFRGFTWGYFGFGAYLPLKHEAFPIYRPISGFDSAPFYFTARGHQREWTDLLGRYAGGDEYWVVDPDVMGDCVIDFNKVEVT